MNTERIFEVTHWRHRWCHHHKKTFLGHNLRLSFHICVQIEAVFNISKFSKWPPFWARDKFFTGCYTGSWIYQKDSHEHFRHFERLIDVVAQILTEIYQFKNLTYFVILWRHQGLKLTLIQRSDYLLLLSKSWSKSDRHRSYFLSLKADIWLDWVAKLCS